MWNLRGATGIDDVHLRRDLIQRAQPALAYDGEDVVRVVLGEHIGGAQRQLLRGIPDAVVGAGLAEVVTRDIAGCMLRAMIVKNASLARSTTPASNASSKATTPGPSVSARMSSDCKRPAVGGRDARCRVHQYVLLTSLANG